MPPHRGSRQARLQRQELLADAARLKRRAVFRAWRQLEDLGSWRADVMAAMARLAAPVGQEAPEGASGDGAAVELDLNVEGIREPTNQEVVEVMLARRLEAEGLEAGGATTASGDRHGRPSTTANAPPRAPSRAPSRAPRRARSRPRPAGRGGHGHGAAAGRRRRRSVGDDEGEEEGLAAAALPAAASAGLAPAQEAARPAPSRWRRPVGDDEREVPAAGPLPVECLVPATATGAAGSGLDEVEPITSIREVERKRAAKLRIESAALVQKYMQRNRSTTMGLGLECRHHFARYVSAVPCNPHRRWTERLARAPDAAKVATDEIILTVVVCNTLGRKEQEFDILGSQRLHDLRDAFHFASDWMFDGPTRLKSASFFIDGVFYSDRRDPSAIDYSVEIIDWLSYTKEPSFLRAKQSRSMDVRLVDLDRIPFGEMCVYIHQGDIEHNVYFTNARLLHAHDDCHFAEAYPILTFMRRYVKRKCYACLQNYAMWLVTDSSKCPYNPSFWCYHCFRRFFQDAEGNYIPPVDYKVFPYLHDEL